MRWIGISVLLAAACAASPTKLVERAIEASGGEEALRGVHSYHIASDGTWAGEPYSVLTHWRDRSRASSFFCSPSTARPFQNKHRQWSGRAR